MIPQRMFSNEFSGSGLKDRVTACRKRLRENRVMFKAHASAAVEEALMKCPSFGGGENDEAGALPEIEPEVGIT